MRPAPLRTAAIERLPAFTLVEVLVSTAVLVLIILSITLLFNAARSAIGLNNNHSDADAQARAVFDRMALDFAQMVRRPDVDYYLKDKSNTPQVGNDQLAFYSQVPGYCLNPDGTSAAVGTQSPASLVVYRINADSTATNVAYNKLERMGWGLLWNGVSTTTGSALVFSAQSISTIPNTLSVAWPAATSTTKSDTASASVPSHYELASSQVFRMEYFYLLRGQVLANGTVLAPIPSLTPWDGDRIKNIPGMTDHTSVAGLRDVSAIVVTLALADSRSRATTTDAQWAQLGSQMLDVTDDTTASGTPNMLPGNLELQWQSVADNAASVVNKEAAAGIRIYQKYFYLPQNPTP